MWKGQLSSLIHMAWQVHVCTPKQTLLLPLQYKLAMPDDQFIFSSWLPSPRFELRTLAGYNSRPPLLWLGQTTSIFLHNRQNLFSISLQHSPKPVHLPWRYSMFLRNLGTLFTTTRCRNPKEFHHMKCHLLTVAFHVLGKLQETKTLSRVEKDLYVWEICKVFLCLPDMANI